jgi:hypothetical protein
MVAGSLMGVTVLLALPDKRIFGGRYDKAAL